MVAALIMGAAIRPRPIFVKETESVEGLGATAMTSRARWRRPRGSFGPSLLTAPKPQRRAQWRGTTKRCSLFREPLQNISHCHASIRAIVSLRESATIVGKFSGEIGRL